MNGELPDPNVFKGWFTLLRDRFPVAALALPGLGIGLFFLFMSASALPEIRPFVMWVGVIMMGAGALAYVLSIIVAVFRK